MASRIITTSLAVVFTLCAFSQETLSCGTPEPTLLQKRMLDQQIALEQTFDSGINMLTAIQEVAIIAHVIRRDDGTGGLSEEELQGALDNVNTYYANAGLSFFYLDFNYIDETDYYDFITSDEGKLTSQYNYDGAINIYFANSVGNGEGGSYCGYAYYPGGFDVILMDNDCTMNGSTLPHEIGHFFFLYHTHDTGVPELVVRPGEEGDSNGSLPANCDSAGDYLCDTEADPNLSGKVDGADCSYTGGEIDVNGDAYLPDENNIMSYSLKGCRNIFTDGQYSRMNSTYSTSRGYLHTAHVLAEAEASDREACPGETITFNSDRSINAVNYSWTFEGGSPSSSSDPNPTVSYETTGIYDVVLTVDDGEGNFHTLNLDDHVDIRGEITSEITSTSGSFEGIGIQELTLNEDDVSWVLSTEGASDGSQSLRLRLFLGDVGSADYLVLDPLNSTLDKTFKLTFDYAYARIDDASADILEVVYRDPCGEWVSVWSKQGSDLATAPNDEDNWYVPQHGEWMSEEVDITIDQAVDISEIAIKVTSSRGNTIYIDNYSIDVIIPDFSITDVSVMNASCPDAMDGSMDVSVSVEGNYEYSIDGENYLTSNSISSLAPGAYTLSVINSFNHEETQEVVVGYENEYPEKPDISLVDGELLVNSTSAQSVQWYLDGAILDGETASAISIQENGDYSVSVSNGACSALSDPFIILSAGDSYSSLSIYPNPVADILNLAYSSESKSRINSITIADLSGKEIIRSNATSSFDVSELKKGIYLLRLELNNQKITRRFVKK